MTTKDTLKQAYSAKSDAIIWKVILDDTNYIMLWESRTEDKKVFFNAYDFKNKKTLLHNYSFEESWLVGVQQIVNGVAYFHGFESEVSPVQKGMMALNLYTQKIIWQNFSVGVQLINETGVVVFDSKILPKKFKLLNLLNGETQKSLTMDEVSGLIPINNQILLPQLSTESKLEDCNYSLIYKELELTSFFMKNSSSFDQYVQVKKENEIIFTDIINSDIQKLSFDTFFVWKSMLVYIRNKTEIVSYFV